MTSSAVLTINVHSAVSFWTVLEIFLICNDQHLLTMLTSPHIWRVLHILRNTSPKCMLKLTLQCPWYMKDLGPSTYTSIRDSSLERSSVRGKCRVYPLTSLWGKASGTLEAIAWCWMSRTWAVWRLRSVQAKWWCFWSTSWWPMMWLALLPGCIAPKALLYLVSQRAYKFPEVF